MGHKHISKLEVGESGYILEGRWEREKADAKEYSIFWPLQVIMR